jgi:enoyl-CoA hydratase
VRNEYFQISTEYGIAHLQLNRPDRLNAMGLSFFTELRDAVLAFDDAGDARALVISSTGEHFSAGMALDVFTGTMDLFDNSSPGALRPRP